MTEARESYQVGRCVQLTQPEIDRQALLDMKSALQKEIEAMRLVIQAKQAQVNALERQLQAGS